MLEAPQLMPQPPQLARSVSGLVQALLQVA
jgi:hypothetical protein